MNIFGTANKTVDGVMAAFTATIADLNEVHQRESEEAQRLENEAKRLLIEASNSRIEASRAESIAARIGDLVGATA